MNKKQVAGSLAKYLAGHNFKAGALDKLAQGVVDSKMEPLGVDVCTHGICLDYVIDRKNLGDLIDTLKDRDGIAGIKVFPWGIVNPDRFRVTVEHAVPR